LAELDQLTAETGRLIGVIANTIQCLNSRYWETEDETILPDIAVLTSLLGVVIDSAKRVNPVDSNTALREIRKKYLNADSKFVYPTFMKYQEKSGDATNHIYRSKEETRKMLRKSTMDYIVEVVDCTSIRPSKYGEKGKRFSEILKKNISDKGTYRKKQKESIIEKIRSTKNAVRNIYLTDSLDYIEKNQIAAEKWEECYKWINNLSITPATMLRLLYEMEDQANKDIKLSMFHALFQGNKDFFLLIKNSKEAIGLLRPCEPGEENGEDIVDLYGIKYKVKD
jgi:hypothetical protein